MFKRNDAPHRGYGYQDPVPAAAEHAEDRRLIALAWGSVVLFLVTLAAMLSLR